MSTTSRRSAVIALGGNALSPAGERSTINDQFRHTREMLGVIVELARDGWDICIVHGNGPQVGDELVRNDAAHAVVEPLPLGVLVAATAGWIGYMIQQSLRECSARRRRLAARCDGDHSGDRRRETIRRLQIPRKFVGHELTAERAARAAEQGMTTARDGNGRLRRVVASPRPLAINEEPVIRELLDSGVIVVACGGGGVPAYIDRIGRTRGIGLRDRQGPCGRSARDCARCGFVHDSHGRRCGLRRLGNRRSTRATQPHDRRGDAARRRRRIRRGEHGAQSASRTELRAPHWRTCHYYRAFARPRRRRGNRGH